MSLSNSCGLCHIHLSACCLLVMTSRCVFLRRILHHRCASSCPFLQQCRKSQLFLKCLQCGKMFRRASLKLMYTDNGCHHVCCGVFGFVVVSPPNDGCLAGILLFGISLSLPTLQWQGRRWSQPLDKQWPFQNYFKAPNLIVPNSFQPSIWLML